MQLNLKGMIADNPDGMKQFSQRRIASMLSRYADRIDRINISVDNLKGAIGGIDKRCTIEAAMAQDGRIEVVVDDSEYRSAIHRALERLARRIEKHLRDDVRF